MGNEYNNALVVYCALLDSIKHSVDLTCSLARLGLVRHGHKDGFNDWVDGASGKHLTGPADVPPQFDERARRLLARFTAADSEKIGPMPGFENTSAPNKEKCV